MFNEREIRATGYGEATSADGYGYMRYVDCNSALALLGFILFVDILRDIVEYITTARRRKRWAPSGSPWAGGRPEADILDFIADGGVKTSSRGCGDRRAAAGECRGRGVGVRVECVVLVRGRVACGVVVLVSFVGVEGAWRVEWCCVGEFVGVEGAWRVEWCCVGEFRGWRGVACVVGVVLVSFVGVEWAWRVSWCCVELCW
ncbi:hypothetical protein C7M84_015293 [Penaeus vannamei]|uniref:Uncharacterized protein n=1 Tax=Penaeus vannamei TaxID=6689 RepID=A0A3R7MPA3_PENVA|nr:hypothetical protein C7M84_015293 [Penaeus vannamei]